MSAIVGQGGTYWDKRFHTGDWSKNGGNYQSLEFMRAIMGAVVRSPVWPEIQQFSAFECEGESIAYTPAVVIDYGCAEGDGTAVLQSYFPMARVVGMDWSTEAIDRAKLRWPTIEFAWGDIEAPQDYADVIVTSHTIEHLTDPAQAISNLLGWCRWLIVAVPPISEEERGGHDGAVPLDEWKPLTSPVHEAHFNTVRWVLGEPWLEGTHMLVYRGSLDRQGRL